MREGEKQNVERDQDRVVEEEIESEVVGGYYRPSLRT